MCTGLYPPSHGVHGAVRTAMGEEGYARCSLRPPHVQVHFSLCLLLYCCFPRCGGCFEPIPSRPALKLFSGHLCHDKLCLDTSTWSFSCATWGCVCGLRFCSPSATGGAVFWGTFTHTGSKGSMQGAAGSGSGDVVSCLPSFLQHVTSHAACVSEGRDGVLGSAQGAHQEPLPWKSLGCCVWAAKPCTLEDLLLPLLMTACC